MLCLLLLSFLSGMLFLYMFFELHYFLRVCLCVFWAHFVKGKCHILDTTHVIGICLTNDIDALLRHMNNARYLRELDFARIDFYERTNLYKLIRSKGGAVYQSALTIRYRRFIRPFRLYEITSKIIYWDDQYIYMEHKFINTTNQFVHCIAICRQRVVNYSVYEIMSILLASETRINHIKFEIDDSAFHVKLQGTQSDAISLTTTSNTNLDQSVTAVMEYGNNQMQYIRPQMPPELLKWIEYNNLSSCSLKKNG